jgi:PRC-barrel domain
VDRLRASTLVRAPVLVRGIRLGEVETVLLDPIAPRILGLDVRCGDGSNRFLPFAAARVRSETIEIDSSLLLLDEQELSFYRSRGRALTAVPELVDALVAPDGVLEGPLPARC